VLIPVITLWVFLVPFALLVPTLAQTNGVAASTNEVRRFDTALHDEIIAMAADDQRVRQNTGPMSPEETHEMNRVDQAHEKRMNEIITRQGWPGKALVGQDGAHDAWLIVQHCSPPFQEKCLPLLEHAVTTGEASKTDYAYLLDRVRMYQGKPQLYGTQFRDNKLWKIEDPEHVDDRRRTVGLGPLKDYVEGFQKTHNLRSTPPEPVHPSPARNP
jgi:hypothetical protein